ncbi:MAG TPA: ATP-binding protein [Terriglobia bacterium]|jgi:two-component system nitrogen regulation sensor histidine kinase NtrY|nr:ATP-binding protein [Terriglobia bacterium]
MGLDPVTDFRRISGYGGPRVGRPGSRLSFESRILLLTLAGGAPGLALAIGLMLKAQFSSQAVWTLGVLLGLVWLGFAFSVRNHITIPLQTLSNVLSALREGDYSLRARGTRKEDSLSQLVAEANALGETLRSQRLGALEATTLLRKVMEEIDVGVFTFDGEGRLRLVNRAGERLLAQPSERVLGASAGELGLEDCLEAPSPSILSMTFPGGGSGATRWGVHRSNFREGGLRHSLLVLSDMSRALRDEELKAWQRLVRVIGHELNNSLAPIKSVAASLESLLNREPQPPDWRDDMREGLRIIAGRSEALARFMESYARLARLPKPRRAALDIGAWVRRVASLETRMKVALEPGPDTVVQADGDQLDQLLINLLRNAVDAALETGGGVTVGWGRNNAHLDLWIRDDGLGLSNTANLFVPFFTTKQGGSGIGLVLSRQIAEAHGGMLTLANRTDGAGCEARLRIPVE